MARAWNIPRLRADEALEQGLRKIIRTRCREMFSYAQGTLEGSDIEALHSMRVSSRRLQAVLRIHRSCFPEKKFLRLYLPLRQLIRALGNVRELDVLITTLNKRLGKLTPPDRPALMLLIARCNQERSQRRRSLNRALRAALDGAMEQRILEFADRSLR